ncbi:MAG TPA: YbhB/YbcL family Raf kinase inhibitor-like protein [Methanoregulaceae archaeon]|nr:YbhB/YbcL family Raf kinase inhibitor-like protein [Burkholderiaceae bacterium]NLH25094.1 YbhB/YbcL family Raf kinase inhibitor-like protein [Methanomicrobiales archaeon]HMZ31391.1 YbhB/YbcL family Raf kinase inhibitor-like protein [Methanoregulaceae archaeon]HNB02776.1 YbhB/YbcL family Raf kinase inhibitor-like protein [Methanoregulaceae archaeon]HNJ81184.1 YbhB/YbcL family Raf kinase inhibitor-like protein [Methanoregulaceae archaeon]
MEPLRVRLDFLEFPPTHTCDGANTSPRIRLSGLNAVSVAVMAVNPFQPSCCSFCPWLIWNIPAGPEIPAGISPEGIVSFPITAVQGMNDFGRIGYSGPCPPQGTTHRYTFKVYGLDAMLTLAPGATKAGLITAMRSHVLQYGETVALYSR